MSKLNIFLTAATLMIPALGTAETNLRDVIKPGDVLSLVVFDEPDLSFTEQRVDQEGSVTIALLGRIQLAGKSVQQANQEITSALAKDYLVNPGVTLNIVTYGEYQTVSVKGRVSQPGTVSFQKGEWIDALRAIERAGGLTQPESRTLVLQREGAPDVRGDIVLIRSGKQSRMTLRDGDTLIVGE
jgi:polysaccharide export outer membrane protein